jgi:hypothetical protein
MQRAALHVRRAWHCHHQMRIVASLKETQSALVSVKMSVASEEAMKVRFVFLNISLA